MNDEGAEIIVLPTAGDPAREVVEDEHALDALGLRHDLDEYGYAKVNKCWHNEYAAKVDQAARRVYCGGCGKELDPYEVLENVARKNAVIVDRRRRLLREIHYLETRVEDLKREERNAKARIRNARKRAGLETRPDGFPLCPVCGKDELSDLRNPVPSPKGDLYCNHCGMITARNGRAVAC